MEEISVDFFQQNELFPNIVLMHTSPGQRQDFSPPG